MAEDPFAAWCRLYERDGRRATMIELYRLAGAERGLEPHELPLAERTELALKAIEVQLPGYGQTAGTERDHEPIELAPYDERWPALFETWRSRLAAALGPAAESIEHVGSTAVPGLTAKPVIDLQVCVADLEDEDAYVPRVESCGLVLRSRAEARRFFLQPPDRPREVHVHVCEAGGDWAREHLLFRDQLRTHPEARARYEAAKLEAARRWADDRWAYTEAKTDVILGILAEAEAAVR